MYRDLISEFDRLRQQMENFFNDVNMPMGRWRQRDPSLWGSTTRSYPLINIKDKGTAFEIEALMPGTDPTSLSVTANKDTLTLAGEKAPSNGTKPERFHRSERFAGKFSRSFSLPTPIDVNGIQAEMSNGILKVHVPKAEEARPRNISVKVSS